MKPIPRTAGAVLSELAKRWPAIVITGPRQSGKTTLAQSIFPSRAYVSLEDLDTREFAQADPRGFLKQYADGAILDEVQRCPDLFSYLQTYLDSSKRMGRFILTGSQQFGLMSGITQSLAGRVASLTLLPFSLHELQAANKAPTSVEQLLFEGLYPPVHDRRPEPGSWYANYVITYIERDVRQMINVRDLSAFQRFVRMCAARTGQILNLSSLAGDCGITHNTAKSWLSVLEASYIVHLLQPHHANFNKRMIKSPKLYFHDSGLAANLLGIQTATQLATHSARGQLFETWVVSEFLKYRNHRAKPSNLYFWRDRANHEVDILLENADRFSAVEVKSGQTVARDFLNGLQQFSEIAGEALASAALVYGGDQPQVRKGIAITPWREIQYLCEQQNTL